MRATRRDFLKTTLLGAGGMALGGCSLLTWLENIPNRPVRRDIATLAPSDPIIQAYKDAVTAMRALPATDARNWTNQANIHLNHCPHGNWLFLPWHRWYLWEFERICQKLSGMQDFALPYWNWVKNPTIPAAFWGDASNPLFDSSRGIAPNGAISSALVGCDAVAPIMAEPNFLTFGSGKVALAQDQRAFINYGKLERTPHNGVHGAIGGNMGGYSSPLDPIFWLHHNMIEKCWVEWQFVRNNSNTSDPEWSDRHFTEFCDADGHPVDVTVGANVLLPALFYQFDDVPVLPNGCEAGAPPPPPPPAPAGGGEMGARWREFNAARSTTPQETLKARAQAGAAVSVEVVRRFARPRAASVRLLESSTLPVAADAAALRAALAAGDRVFVQLEGVSLQHTTDFFVKVFIGKPDAVAATPESDPHYVGAFAFFDHQHEGHASVGSFDLDASATLRRLPPSGNDISVNVVLVPYPNRRLATETLDIGSVQLQIVRSVITKP